MHDTIRYALGTIVEYAALILGALKLLQLFGRFLEWWCNNMSPFMVTLGIASIALLILAVLLYDYNEDEKECEDEENE
jgi:uncharacterized membrane protein